MKYLEGRQDEKQNLLEGIDAGSTLDYDHFQEEKRQIQAQRLSQTTGGSLIFIILDFYVVVLVVVLLELNGRVKALELQLEQKRQEVVSLTDVMVGFLIPLYLQFINIIINTMCVCVI